MENEDNTLDIQEENQVNEADAVEETADEGTTEESQGEEAETPEAQLAHAKAEAAKYRRLLEKAQKPKSQQTKTPQKQVSPSLNVEETVLLANGMPEELLNELKVIAELRHTTLIKAQNDPLFLGIKNQFEEKQKQQGASLGASRGSGSVKAQKDFSTPGLTREEHRKMVMDTLGR